nr:inner membrane transport protein YdiM [Salmonella sp. NCTC 7297]
MKNRYFSTAVGLYFNYLVHGMGVILMSLNMSSLEQQWHTTTAGVSIVISSLGIGRLSVLLIAGMLSDRFGRRPFIILGVVCYLAFFIGILHSRTLFYRLCLWLFSGYGQQFSGCGNLSKFDGGVPSLTQYGKYSH